MPPSRLASTLLLLPPSPALTSTEGKGCGKLSSLEEAVAAHLCPPSALGLKAKAMHLSKPCRTISALAGRAYSVACQAGPALQMMAVLQVFQAKLLSAMEESGLSPNAFKELSTATDLALRTTKATVQAIVKTMAICS